MRIGLDPNLVDADSNRGLAYSDKGDNDRAIKDHDVVICVDPRFAEAYFNRGLAYSSKRDHNRAIKDYSEAIRLDPKNASNYFHRGGAYFFKDDYDRAIKEYDEAIRLDPKYGLAYEILAGGPMKTRVISPGPRRISTRRRGSRHCLLRQGRLRPRHQGVRRRYPPRSERMRTPMSIAAAPTS